MFISDPKWLLLQLVSIILISLLALREAFRFRLLNTPYNYITTISAVVISILFITDLILMIIFKGWLSLLVGGIISIIIGSLLTTMLKKRFIKSYDNLIDEGNWENNLTEIAIRKALNSKKIQTIMTNEQISELDIKDLNRRLKALGISNEKANSAILNHHLISWFFKNFRDNSKDKNSLAIELALYAKSGQSKFD
ncbi:MAG: hypothetical protein ABIP35_15005 [Ginsengibacter sp.]